MNTKQWITLFFSVAVVCVIAAVTILPRHKGTVVVISQNGCELYSVDLSSVAEPYDLTVDWNGSINKIHITSETVYISYAQCENQICVRHGPLMQSGSPITCLPNRLVIRWAAPQIDG